MSTRLTKINDWPKFARSVNWSAAVMAKECRVSVRTLHRYFMRQFGENPRNWIRAQRQHSALELVREGFTMKEIAGELGYGCPEIFSREFKRYWGKCPTKMNPAELSHIRNLTENVRLSHKMSA
jgi:AraC-like DNA-binding protein